MPKQLLQPARLAAVPAISEAPQNASNHGHGHRLTAAFEALEAFPALAESRERVLHLVGMPGESPAGDMVAAIEADVALVISILRVANRSASQREKVASIPLAINRLTLPGVEALVSQAKTFDFFEHTSGWDVLPQRFRLHGVATQRVADRLMVETRYKGDRDGLLVGALLHDIGKLVLAHAYPGYPSNIHGNAKNSEERVARERAELGVDHALVGGVLARRWGLPTSLASAIERHHAADAHGDAAMIKLADLLTHYLENHMVNPDVLLEAAHAVGLTARDLRAMLYELPMQAAGERRRSITPSPLSPRESDVLRQLADGKMYKGIAESLSLSTSTVRTHLHNIYSKLGVQDRAQAVLTAVERGWI